MSAWVSDSYLSDSKPTVQTPSNNQQSASAGKSKATAADSNCAADCNCDCGSDCDCASDCATDCQYNCGDCSIDNCNYVCPCGGDCDCSACEEEVVCSGTFCDCGDCWVN